MNTLVIVLTGMATLVDKVPSANDVKAGWGAFALFLLLAAAVAGLGWSLTRHLNKARTNADAGLFGDDDKA